MLLSGTSIDQLKKWRKKTLMSMKKINFVVTYSYKCNNHIEAWAKEEE